MTELKGTPDHEGIDDHNIRRLDEKLHALDSQFRSLHFELINLIEESEDDTLAEEQDVMDKHEENVDTLAIDIKKLFDATHTDPVASNEREFPYRKLTQLEESLDSIISAIHVIPADIEDLALVQQYQEELSDHKEQLSKCRDGLSNFDLEEGDEPLLLHAKLKKSHFECCHVVRKILNTREVSHTSRTSSSSEAKGLKIPKLKAPTFDGNILNWTHFWEQFSISIDEHSNLSNAEKFVYLQHCLKGRSAK